MKAGISVTLSPLALKRLDFIADLVDSNRSAVLERLLREIPTPTDAIIEKTHCKILLSIPSNHKAALAYVSGMAGLTISDIKQDHIDNIPAGINGVMLAAIAVENALLEKSKCENESTSPGQSIE